LLKKILKNSKAIKAVSFKLINVLSQFLLLPLVGAKVSNVEFGLFATLNTMVILLLSIDLGLVNAIKNPLFKAVIQNDKLEINKILSTSFFFSIFLSLVFICGIFTYLSFNNFLDIHSVNITRIDIIIFTGCFAIRYVFQILHSINHGFNKFFLNDLIQMLGSLLTLIITSYFYLIDKLSLSIALIIFMIVPVIVYSLFFYFYWIKKNLFTISSSFFHRSTLIFLVKSSGVFFYLQISWLLLTNSIPLLIAKKVGLEFAGEYNIIARLFSFLYIFNVIFVNNYWGDVTDSLLTKNKIKFFQIIKTMLIVTPLFVTGCFVIYLFCDQIVLLWMHKILKINEFVKLEVCFFYVSLIFLSTINIFMNGIGYFKVQIYLCSISFIIYFTLINLFISLDFLSPVEIIILVPCMIFFFNFTVTIPFFIRKINKLFYSVELI
jgi:O-antigen/teichoic acid export membrane protein